MKLARLRSFRHHAEVPAERLLVNFFYANPVGHAVEALHYCLGHHSADPTREVSVVLNAGTAVELAGFCPFVSHAFAIDARGRDACAHSSIVNICPCQPFSSNRLDRVNPCFSYQ